MNPRKSIVYIYTVPGTGVQVRVFFFGVRAWLDMRLMPSTISFCGLGSRVRVKVLGSINCFTAMGHNSGFPVHRDGPLVACIKLAFSTNNIYCY